jgi:putative transcriptional regulator
LTAETPLKDHFLLAMPVQGASYFANTLTYMCEHTAEGAMGLIVNRPRKVTIPELFTQLGIKSKASSLSISVMEGGPVSPERAFILHSDDKKFSKSQAIGKGIVLTTNREALQAIAAGEGPKSFLIALGYVGWGKGQLENELQENVWLTCAANTEIVFQTPFNERINKTAAGLGIDFRLMSGQAGHA